MKRVILYGDFMTDRWHTVRPTMLSPEAPVLVTKSQDVKDIPGGAGNAARNCLALGAQVHIIGLATNGYHFTNRYNDLFEAEYHERLSFHMLSDPRWMDITKERIIDEHGRHLIRLDFESPDYDLSQFHDIDILHAAIYAATEIADVLFISDYGKGSCHRALFNRFKPRPSIFTLVNAKPENIKLYDWMADCIVLNKYEAMQACGFSEQRVVPYLVEQLRRKNVVTCEHLVVTEGDRGLYWHQRGMLPCPIFIPALQVEAADVTGAGDTICATIAARGEVSRNVLEVAVKHAASVVSQRGTGVPQ